MSEIKIDKVSATQGVSAKLSQPTMKQPADCVKKQESVSVTNHLSQLVNLLDMEDFSPDENSRVMVTKSLVESGQYKVDVDVLSQKLLSNGLLN
jgi:anti-sigma28 factor (negative regulator of flagellin synthesis)